VPLDGIGFQTHLALQYGYPGSLEDNLRRFSRLGLDTALTEVDVRMQLPATEEKLSEQASWYRDRLLPGEGAALPWDERLNPKPAYQALREALR
jgi:endo-1,4-beta-xylanase